MAVWFLVATVANFIGYNFTLHDDPEVRRVELLTILSFAVIPFLTGAALWALSGWISAKVVPERLDQPVTAQVDAALVHRAAVSLLGLWIFVQVLPEFVHSTYLFVSMKFARPPDLPRDEATDYKVWVYAQAGFARYASLLTRAVVGLALYLWPGRIAEVTLRGLKRVFDPPIAESEPAGASAPAAEQRDEADEARDG
jgi:hypothetical protein